jgi:hypothetical protein
LIIVFVAYLSVTGVDLGRDQADPALSHPA